MIIPQTLRLGLVAAIAAAVAALCAAPAGASPITGLTKTNQIFTFDSATPGTVSANTPVTGLNAGDTLVAIDRNPVDGQLYGLGSQSRMYRIASNGTATQVGPVFPTLLNGATFDIDFTGSGGARVVSDTEQNFVWTTNGSQTVQTALDWANGDVNDGEAILVNGIAYSNNVHQANNQTAYAYDCSTEAFVTIGGQSDPPSGGKLHTVGFSSLFSTCNVGGLDEAPDGTLFALLRVTTSRLFTVNKANGTVTSIGNIGNGSDTVADIATDAVENKFRFSSTVYSVDESGAKATITVTRGQSKGFARVKAQTADASAAGGQDYDTTSVNVFFQEGDSESTFDVRIQPDALDESDETFTVALSDPEGGNTSIIAPSTAVVQIGDNDSGPVPSTPVTVLTTTNDLVTLDSASPGTVSAPLAITGLPGGEELVGIDRRPATGGLYALGKQSRLYRIDESSGAATQIGDVFSPPLAGGTAWALDFDPVTDRLRIVATGGSGQQLRVNPDDGSVTTDSPLIFNAGDVNIGTPSLTAIAYSNNLPGAASATLWAYDYTHDTLARVGSPGGAPVAAGSGATSTIGPTLVRASVSVNVGLDIGLDGRAWALMNQAGKTRLHLVNLESGENASVGDIGTGAGLYRDLTLPALSQSITLSGGSYDGSEAAGSATVTVTRGQTRGMASVAIATADGSATGGSDYTPTNGTVTFGDGEASKAVSIPIANDSAVESPESLSVVISDPRGGVASLGGTTSATVTIADNDVAGGGGGGGGGVDPKAVVKLCGSSKQDLAKQKSVVICLTSNEASTADLTGKLTIAGVKKPITLSKLTKQKLAANKQKSLKVKLSTKQISALKAALKKRKKVTATISIKVSDSAGNVTSASRKVTAQVAKKKKK